MGFYGSKRDKTNSINNNKNIKVSIKPEALYKSMANYLNFTQLKIIENQKINSICKIINGDKLLGTGFLTLIPYPDRLNQLQVLITCYHVINGIENEIKLIFNDKFEKILKLNNKRKIYINESKDITIIEIKKEDNYNLNNFLDIDYDIFENINLNDKFKSIYLIHFPFGKESSLSIGTIEKIEDELINHKCATEFGSSGAPIINLNNFRIIGIHQGTDGILSVNTGILLTKAIKNLNQKKIYMKKKYYIMIMVDMKDVLKMEKGKEKEIIFLIVVIDMKEII